MVLRAPSQIQIWASLQMPVWKSLAPWTCSGFLASRNQVRQFATVAKTMNHEDAFWKKHIILTRRMDKALPKKVLRGKVKQRPALIGDLSVQDWWTLVTHIAHNEFSDNGFIVLSGRKYNYELRDKTPDDEWTLPEQPVYKTRVRTRVKFIKRKKRKADRMIPHDIPEPTPASPSDDTKLP